MRALILTLALANLLFFGWSYWIDKPAAGRAPRTAAPPLQLAPVLPAVASAGTPSSMSTPGARPADAAAHCSSLGPLADPAAAAVVSTALQARNFNPRERAVQADIADGYWVYVDNLRDAEVRARALKRLARAGVRDAAALASSGQVSVGLFSEQAGANLRAAAVRAAGLEPVIEARSHPVKEYWFDVDLASGVPPPAVTALVQGLNLAAPPAWGACVVSTAPATPAPLNVSRPAGQ